MKKITAVALSAIMLMTPSNILGRVKEKTYYIEAEPGYRVVDVIVNNVSQGPIPSYTFTDFDGTQTLKVVTEKIINNYTITFDKNGGEGTMAPQTFTEGVAKNLTSNTFTRNGYTFKGWAESATGVKKYDNNHNYTATENKTLYAVWELNTYTITYDLQNGNPVSNRTQYTVETSDITLMNPTRNGYTFTGWTGSNGTTPSTNVIIPKGSTGNKHYVANWLSNSCTITFNGNGGTSQSGNTTTQTFQKGQTEKLNTNPFTRNGYTFDGWSKTSNGSRYLQDGQNYTPTGDETLYAIWEKTTYTITYVLNEGNVSGNPTTYDVETPTITLINPTRSGYTFTGWTGSNGTTPSTNVTIPKGSTGHKTYTANWTANTCLVTFNANDGTGVTKTQSYTIGETKPLVENTFTREGYIFRGWSKTNNGAKEFDDKYNYKATGNITLYAVWEQKPKYPIVTYEPANVEITPVYETNSGQGNNYDIINYIIEEGNSTVEEI